MLDGDDCYELSAQYDLGGGAALMGGVRRTYNLGENDGRLRGRRRLHRRLRYLDVLLIPNNGTVRGEGGLRPAFSLFRLAVVVIFRRTSSLP